jgi:uncharacterized membrane protein
MLGKLIYRFQAAIEHRLKDLGFYTGLAFVVLVLLVWYLDVAFLQRVYVISTEHCTQLQGINMALASLLVGILLTTFSVVFVVMQLASSQFSPRILRYFMYSDVRIQQFIGLYLGALTLIFLPQVLNVLFPVEKLQACVLLSVLLNGYCIVVSFPGVITHLSDNMNVSTITNRIKNEVLAEIDHLYPDVWQVGNSLDYGRRICPETENTIKVYWPGESGYLSEVDYAVLDKWFSDWKKAHTAYPSAQLYQLTIVGEFVMAETTAVFILDPKTRLAAPEISKTEATLREMAPKVFEVNKYRSYTQDITFGVRKLVDIAIKAISPAVNDPTTCINCIDYLGEVVRQLAVRRFPSSYSRGADAKGIHINEFDFDEFVDFAYGQIYQWGKHDLVVVKRLLKSITQMVPHVNNPYHLVVLAKEVEDFELERLYAPEASDRAHALEQIESLHKDLQRFRAAIKCRMADLDAKGEGLALLQADGGKKMERSIGFWSGVTGHY